MDNKLFPKKPIQTNGYMFLSAIKARYSIIG